MYWLLLLAPPVIANALDIISTTRAMKHEGVIERNPLLRDSNKKFVMWKGLAFKAASFLPFVFLLVCYPDQKIAHTVMSIILTVIPLCVAIRNFKLVQ